MTELQKHVDDLVEKAAAAPESTDSLRFSQAALNVAHTKNAMVDLPKPK